ncbi:alpha N-terminal protein methyltransferase 1A [Rozella allomycis CSF55]|uniref:Alpha N-terminal protein methyltransferase 1 n=1 Tax=Rozella allomycis (strain CSF55) TaxID=988480 RepID=A0A4P9YPA2_ROZAC|nr:alpha N-terminal protein methyltransferase 1A [Rozella allomycis CSF55]
MVESGFDSKGKEFDSVDSYWNTQSKEEWYEKSLKYWETQPDSVDGMLGGFGYLSDIDVTCSLEVLNELKANGMGKSYALGKTHLGSKQDCGAGIGRVSKNVLSQVFSKIDLLEPVSQFINKAAEELSSIVGESFCCKLEDFQVQKEKYDCIWVQWVSIYLNDDDFLHFLDKARASLKKGGYIVIKDNVSRSGFHIDDDDASITRSDEMMLAIFSKANFNVKLKKQQENFPRQLFPVFM